MNAAQYYQYFILQLRNVYSARESENIAKIIFKFLFKTSVLDLNTILLSEDIKNHSEKFLQRLLQHEPLQYVLGHTVFYGLKVEVNKDVLIPRPETEELVEWIENENVEKKNLSVLDIGTGSGCIALALKSKLNHADISAMDISEKALEVAKKNADILNLGINFYLQDISVQGKWNRFPNKKFDVIVSNPPYIPVSEMKNISKNVLDYEPHLALFVEDKSPFIFYETIAEFALKYLKDDGALYFEINESHGQETVSLLFEKGYDALLKKDMSGKDRMVKAKLRNKY